MPNDAAAAWLEFIRTKHGFGTAESDTNETAGIGLPRIPIDPVDPIEPIDPDDIKPQPAPGPPPAPGPQPAPGPPPAPGPQPAPGPDPDPMEPVIGPGGMVPSPPGPNPADQADCSAAQAELRAAEGLMHAVYTECFGNPNLLAKANGLARRDRARATEVYGKAWTQRALAKNAFDAYESPPANPHCTDPTPYRAKAREVLAITRRMRAAIALFEEGDRLV